MMKKMKKKIDAIKLKAEIDKYIDELNKQLAAASSTISKCVFVSGIEAMKMVKNIIDEMITESEAINYEEE